MKTYILNQARGDNRHNAAGKAMTDVFKIMDRCGVKVVPGVPKNAGKWIKTIDYLVLIFYCIFVFGSKDACIFVYQDNAFKIKLLKRLKFIRRYKIICFVNDVNSIRGGGLYSDANKAAIDRDFSLISTADVIWAPNEGSKKYMLERGMTNEIQTVDVWDYLMDEEMGEKCDQLSMAASKHIGKWKIGFAGNLGKSEFLSDISEVVNDTVEYHLWGDCDNREITYKGVLYEGSVSPDVLPLELAEKCQFGLVWDGKKSTCIEGGYGEYLKFNNSHKCGCYLASGIPVIVWRGSGAAYLVEKEVCGILIDGLQDIAGILNSMSANEYDKIRESAKRVASGVRTGYYLTNCYRKL